MLNHKKRVRDRVSGQTCSAQAQQTLCAGPPDLERGTIALNEGKTVMATVMQPIESIPLTSDETGTIRIGGTRITLDVFAGIFRQGATPEQIADQFPSLNLPDVYAVVTWMLRHPDELNEYLSRRHAEAAEIRAKVEALCPPDGFRARLLARKSSQSDP